MPIHKMLKGEFHNIDIYLDFIKLHLTSISISKVAIIEFSWLL